MKGQFYTLESIISILMILFIVIFLFQNPSPSPEFKMTNYKLKAYEGLEVIEKTGELRKYVADNNATAIDESLNSYIPSFLSRAVVVYNDTNNLTTEPSFSDKNESISVSYFLAGDFDDYKAREVRVYLWGPAVSEWISITTEFVDTVGSVSWHSSIAIDSNDKPHISHELYITALRYCYTNDFSTWNCQDADPYDTLDYTLNSDRAIAIKKGRLCDSTSFSSQVHMSYSDSRDLYHAVATKHYSYGRL